MLSIISKISWRYTIMIALLLTMTGCAALNISIEKSDLDVQTRASESIFLEPVAPSKRIIFVSVRNTSDRDLAIKPRIVERLENSGYRITKDPDQAYFMLQANILKVGKDNQDASDSYLEAGFTGASIGNVVSNSSDSGKGIVIGALAIGFAPGLVSTSASRLRVCSISSFFSCSSGGKSLPMPWTLSMVKRTC